MDTSEQYIKMCEKAEEITKGHKLVTGDVYYRKEAYCGCFCPACRPSAEVGLVWLPRQDQLQEMVLSDPEHPEYDNWEWRLKRFKMWHSAKIWGTNHPFASMEQLWLAFVMKEKYGKVWNGKEWVVPQKGVVNGSKYPTAPEYTFPS